MGRAMGLPWIGRKQVGGTRAEWRYDDRQARFWRRRPDGFAGNEKEHIIYVPQFERVSDAGEGYVAETQRAAPRCNARP